MKVAILVETHKCLGVRDGAPVWEREAVKMVDHSNSSDRKWLMNHIFWALRNSRQVAVMPATIESN